MSPLGPFADRPDQTGEEDAPPRQDGAIPGLRGAPVRTPVKPGRARVGAALWPAVLGRLVTRQIWIELYGMPGYGLTLGLGRALGFAASPRDFRPVDPAPGKAVLSGRFALAGATMEAAEPAEPWNRPSPSRAFAAQLHAFAWLPGLMTQGERGAREAARLTLAWNENFARWSPFAWEPRILSRRVMNLACAARRMGQAASEPERQKLADIMARQARQLLRPPGGLAGRAERFAAAAVAGCVLSGGPGASIRMRALSKLDKALTQTVQPDGGHAARSPEAGLELLLDLLTLDDALAQLSLPTPQAVGQAIERLTRALRLQTLPDGRLAGFHGGGPSTAERVAAARAHDEADREDASGQVGGLIRIASPLITIVADAEAPPQGGWSEAACAQPLALVVTCGRDRLMTGCDWTSAAADRQALRLSPAHSTLTLGEQPLGEPLGGWTGELLGPRLVGDAIHVRHDAQATEGAVWLELGHAGWKRPFGLIHQRRLYLDQRLDELRAEERLHPPADGPVGDRPIAAPYAVRFQLEPGVQASLSRDRRAILLRGPSGRGWWFRTDGPDLAIEPAVHVDEGLTRRSLQIVVRGSARTDAETKVRWKLSPAGAADDPH